MVLQTEFDGIYPSYRAYGDDFHSVESELKNSVDNIYDTFSMLEASDEYDEQEN